MIWDTINFPVTEEDLAAGIDIGKDLTHEIKRVYAFHRLSQILESCKSGKCPDFNAFDQYHIIDISIDHFIELKAFFFYRDNMYNRDEERYYAAKALVDTVLKCKRKPKFGSCVIEAFEKDDEEMSEKVVSVVRRKSYWSAKKNYSKEPDYKDYFDAESFVNNQKKIRRKKAGKSIDADTAPGYLWDNRHLASGMDLMRLCYARV